MEITMLTTLYSVTNKAGKPVAKIYGYHAIKSLVKDGKKFTAKNVKRSNSKQFKIGEFEVTELEKRLNLAKLVFEM